MAPPNIDYTPKQRCGNGGSNNPLFLAALLHVKNGITCALSVFNRYMGWKGTLNWLIYFYFSGSNTLTLRNVFLCKRNAKIEINLLENVIWKRFYSGGDEERDQNLNIVAWEDLFPDFNKGIGRWRAFSMQTAKRWDQKCKPDLEDQLPYDTSAAASCLPHVI